MYSVIGSDGEVYGPVDIATLEQWCKEGRITTKTNLIDPISGRTFKAVDIPEVRAIISIPPTAAPPSQQLSSPSMPSTPPPPPLSQQTPYNYHVHNYMGGPLAYSSPKSRLVAGLLALFLGYLGIHRFYLGHHGLGVFMLLFTILTCGFGAVVTWPWSLIEAVLCFTGAMTDSNGQPLT